MTIDADGLLSRKTSKQTTCQFIYVAGKHNTVKCTAPRIISRLPEPVGGEM
jgi:hypothetical protein